MSTDHPGFGLMGEGRDVGLLLIRWCFLINDCALGLVCGAV